ncbi:MAG: hypothetical protein GY730_05010 [bacterium]|nr:hypothetical protein [bacterium]
MKRTLIFLFVFLFLWVSITAPAYHDHEFDGDHHYDCLACTVSVSFLPLLVSGLSLLVSYFTAGYLLCFSSGLFSRRLILSQASRAPPL